MKKDGQFWLSVVLLAAMAVLLWQNHQLKEQLENLSGHYANTASNLQRQVSNLSQTLSSQLEEQASLWSDSQVDYGELNQTDWTMPVTVQVTPKEIGAETRAVLEMDGQQVEMVRDGVHFTGTVPVPLAKGDAVAQVILSDGAGQRVDTVALYFDPGEYLLVDSYAYFGGTMNYGNQTLTYDGPVDIYIQQRQDASVWPVDGAVVLTIDGQESKRQDITFTERTGVVSVPWQQEIALKPQQQIELWCYLVDNHGLNYHMLLDRQLVDEDGRPNSQNDETGYVFWISDEQGNMIYNAS